MSANKTATETNKNVDTTMKQTMTADQGTNDEKRPPEKEAELRDDASLTPGSAEGDEETIDESIREKEKQGKL